ncbi:keratin, type II cytoskeletal 2 epidermal-like [Haliotis cracherodii]|uniref:keratin, type II cytoskeletal 2 epidermal-like n=1 Tax=Haliotis cracherodii TaxID=6455 RepID=UPI0039E7F747
MRTLPLLLVVTAAVVVVVLAEEDVQHHHLTKRSRSRERRGYGCTTCMGHGYNYGGRSHGGHSHGGHSRRGGGRSRGRGRHSGGHSRGRHSRRRSGGRSRGGSSSESDEYGYGSRQPSCRCPFLSPGRQTWGNGPQFGSVAYGRQTSQNDGYYRQWYRAFSTHPCCAGRQGTITYLQRMQGNRQIPR